MFEDLSIGALRRRKSEKWAAYPPDVLPAFVAETDFALAAPVRATLDAALDAGDTGYAFPGELPAAFAEFAAGRFEWSVDPARVFQVPDVMAGVAQALHVLTAPGSGVVVNPPVYAPFFETIRSIGRTVVEAPLKQSLGGRWDLDYDVLEREFARGAQAYLLCSPHNPVGRVWSHDELHRIAGLASSYGVAVVSDEIHAPLTMPGITFVPFQRIAGETVRSVAVTSASKAWNIAGLKCAVVIAGAEDVREALDARLKIIPTEIEARVGHLGVHASIAAFRHGGEWLDALRAHLDRNRALLGDLLREHIPAARYEPPEATYLGWVDCSELALDTEPAKFFLQRGRVALERGVKFGTGGTGHVRINFGTSSAILRTIVERMSTALAAPAR